MKIELQDLENSLSLLKKQTEKDQTASQFSSISLDYLKKNKESLFPVLEQNTTLKDIFFKCFILNDSFYAFPEYFYVKKYLIPKGVFGFRELTFMSPAMLLLYNSYGLYIARRAKKCREFIKKYSLALRSRHCSYASFSGANICFEKDMISIKKDTLSYIHEYKKFIKCIKEASNPQNGKKIIIKLDVEKYYENFEIKRLLTYLNRFSLADNGGDVFDSSFIEASVDFFKIIGNNGLPQEQSFVLSQYLSDLYLTNFDLRFLNYLRNQNIRFSYYRYVDDIYLIINEDAKNLNSVQEYIQNAEQIIKENLNLNISIKKSEIKIIESREDLKKLILSLSFVSLVDEKSRIESLDISDRVAQRKIIEALKRLTLLKPKDTLASEFNEEKKSLNLVFTSYEDNKILDLLKRNYPSFLTQIRDRLNVDMINIAPKPICAIFDDGSTFYPWLVEKINNEKITDHRFWLIFHHLIHQKEEPEEIKQKISIHYQELLGIFFTKHLSLDELLKDMPKHWLNELEDGDLIECIMQFKKMRIAEIESHLELALNHLTNLLHAFVYSLEKKQNKEVSELQNYKKWDVVAFLVAHTSGLDMSHIIQISKLFERRNKNTISHSVGISISQNEYKLYRDTVMHVLKILRTK